MNKLQKVEVDILEKILKICEKYDIKYYILGGTLLGAVRHKGFIPWDDDIDIGMFRNDYEKFIKVAAKELGNNYILNYYKDHKNEKDYISYYMARVENESVKVINKNANTELVLNAWIDVFPIDGIPNNKIIAFFYKFKMLYLRCLLRLSQYSKIVTKNYKKKDFITRIFIRLGKVINFEKILNKDEILESIDKNLKKYNPENCDKIFIWAGACKSYKFIELYPKKVYLDFSEYDFENIKLVGPKDFNYILSRQYGEYMELPKEEDRNKHSTEIISERRG